MDVDSLVPGTDFIEKIEKAISSSVAVLALIGNDWAGRARNQRLLDNPEDFIRLELSIAMKQNVPIIPVLCERTPMPPANTLPEALRPLARYEAFDLENARWEQDINRLIHVLKPLAITAPRSGTGRFPHGLSISSVPRKARYLIAFGLMVLAVLATATTLLLKHTPNPATAKSVSAAADVAAIRSPDRLVESLLATNMTIHDVPGAASHPRAQFNIGRTSIERPGLAAVMWFPLLGNSASSYIDYFIFRDRASAKTYFDSGSAVSTGDTPKGVGFPAAAVADPTKCHASQSSDQTQSNCVILSDKVVIFTQLITQTNSDQVNSHTASALASQAVSYLNKVAMGARKIPLQPPPGSLSPSDLFARMSLPSNSILNSIGDSLATFGRVGSVTLRVSAVPSNLVSQGSLKQEAIDVKFAEHPGLYHDPSVQYYLFKTTQQAHAWFASLLTRSDSRLFPRGQFDTSGFAQEARCGIKSYPATRDSSPFSSAACYVRWGNVVMLTVADRKPDLKPGDTDLAWSLARWGVSYLDMVVGS